MFLIHFWFPEHAFLICGPIHCRSLHGNFRSVMTRSKTHRPNDHSYIKALFYFGARLCGPRKLFNEIDNIHTRRKKNNTWKQRDEKKSRCFGRRNQRTENQKTGPLFTFTWMGWSESGIGRMVIIGPRMRWGEKQKQNNNNNKMCIIDIWDF